MPTDMSKYPKNWKSEIRPSILNRAGHKCEWCGVKNHAVGVRDKDGRFIDCTDQPMQLDTYDCVDGLKPIKIVLTIAHVHDPDPMNCEPGNLAALCQKCHNKHDAPMRAKRAAATRAKNKRKAQREIGQMSLFEELLNA